MLHLLAEKGPIKSRFLGFRIRTFLGILIRNKYFWKALFFGKYECRPIPPLLVTLPCYFDSRESNLDLPCCNTSG